MRDFGVLVVIPDSGGKDETRMLPKDTTRKRPRLQIATWSETCTATEFVKNTNHTKRPAWADTIRARKDVHTVRLISCGTASGVHAAIND